MCTAIHFIPAGLFGRNLDLEYGYNETVTITPRNYPFHFRHCAPLLHHHAMIGIATVVDGYPLYYEAINEFGLSVAGLNFPNLAYYEKPVTGEDNLAAFEFIPWCLGKCKTLSDVRSYLAKLNLVDTMFSEKYPPTPLHFIIADKEQSIVIEPTAEGIHCYDNPVGILTNAPEFPYHLTRLTDYQTLSPLPPDNHFSSDADLMPYSGAMGAVGLPGDWSSCSRFIRGAFVQCNSPLLPRQDENINQFFHMLQAVSMPMGSIQPRPGVYDITRYSCCCDQNTGIYYYSTYHNNRICAVDMHFENLDGNSVIVYPLMNQTSIFTQNTKKDGASI